MSDLDAAAPEPRYLTYQEFGLAFFDQAVTRERVVAAVGLLAGQPIEVGPLGIGPGKFAQIRASGSIRTARATTIVSDQVSFRLVFPVDITLEIDLAVDVHRFQAHLDVPVVMTARAAAPLSVILDVVPPQPSDVAVTLRSEGLRASMLNRVVGIEGELQRFVARYVAQEVDKPAIRELRTIDVAAAIDKAIASIGVSPTERGVVAADLQDAIAVEIRDNEEQIIEGVTE